MAKKKDLQIDREYNVIKSNALIQKSRYDLSLQEQKIILRIIQMIQPADTEFKEYDFNINDFCIFCGIHTDGKNYQDIKNTLLKLAQKKWWLTKDNGEIVTVGWVAKAKIKPSSGTISVKLDEDLQPYLLQLKDYFTRYSLYYTVSMRSKYSVRLYELFKSYENLGVKAFNIQELKIQLMAESYERWADFKRYVLNSSIKEINMLSDLSVSYVLRKTGRQYTDIIFTIRLKTDIKERLDAWSEIEHRLNKTQVKGQLNMAMREIMPSEVQCD